MAERKRADMAEAFLVVSYACLDISIVNYAELRRLLVEVRGQREKDLA